MAELPTDKPMVARLFVSLIPWGEVLWGNKLFRFSELQNFCIILWFPYTFALLGFRS